MSPTDSMTGSDAFSPQASDARLGHLEACSPSPLPAGGAARVDQRPRPEGPPGTWCRRSSRSSPTRGLRWRCGRPQSGRRRCAVLPLRCLSVPPWACRGLFAGADRLARRATARRRPPFRRLRSSPCARACRRRSARARRRRRQAARFLNFIAHLPEDTTATENAVLRAYTGRSQGLLEYKRVGVRSCPFRGL
jgi:hypothetical protein